MAAGGTARVGQDSTSTAPGTGAKRREQVRRGGADVCCSALSLGLLAILTFEDICDECDLYDIYDIFFPPR